MLIFHLSRSVLPAFQGNHQPVHAVVIDTQVEYHMRRYALIERIGHFFRNIGKRSDLFAVSRL